MLKAILARIWAFWGLILFVATLLIFVWPITFSFLIPEPHGVKFFQAVSRFWMNLFLHGIGCPIKVHNKHLYKKGHQYVITANHQSFMDVPLLTPFYPGPNKTIAKKSMSRIPLFGWVYTRGSVLVDRSSDSSRKQSYDKMKAVLLQDGLCMAIYPEGTRNRTGQLLKTFYDGAFKLAADTQKPIMPVIMLNTAKALPPSKFFYLWPVPLHMHLLTPISVQGKTADMLKAETFAVMWKFLEENK